MVIRKILETTLTAGSTSVTFTDSDIPLSLIRVYASDPDVLPTERRLSGSTITVSFEARSTNMGVALEIVKAGLNVIDALDSDDTAAALSAKQGKVLKSLIDSFSVPALDDLTDVEVEDLQSDDILIYDSVEGKWINTSLPSVPESINDLTDVDIDSPTDGQVLTFNDGVWENTTPSGGGSDEYTTTETQIGTYLGAPLYRKVITGLNISLNQNAWTTLTGITIANGKDLVNCVCYGTYTEQYIINCSKVHLNTADGSIEVRNIESSTTLTAIMLEYTKSTSE